MKHAIAVAAAVFAVGPMAAAAPVGAQSYPSFPPAPTGGQAVQPSRVTAAYHMTKDNQTPVRAFSGPTSMLSDPDDPNIIVAATVDARTKVCQLVVSEDAGLTWHFSKELPAPNSYQYCQDNVAGLAVGALAWGRDGALYYAGEAFGDGEGGFRPPGGHTSEFLSKSTDLGETWTRTLVENNRGTPEPAAADYGVGLAVDRSGPADVVYVGYNRHYPVTPTDPALVDGPVVVATSTDGGETFAPGVDLNRFSKVTTVIAGQTYPLVMEGFFGGPILAAHNGTLLAVTGGQIPSDKLPPGETSNFSAGFKYPMPQLVGRSTDQGKTWTITALGPPVFTGSGSQTGIGWVPGGGPRGTWVAAYHATPADAASSGPSQIVVQRSMDDGLTWTEPLAIDQSEAGKTTTNFYPQMGVSPAGDRIDLVWHDDGGLSDFLFNVRYSYSTDGGATWAPPMLISDRPVDWNFGVSYNSDLRTPPGVASANEYAAIGWADTRLADAESQTQDNFGATVQFEPLPPENYSALAYIAAVFAGLVIAGVILLAVLALRRRGSPASPA